MTSKKKTSLVTVISFIFISVISFFVGVNMDDGLDFLDRTYVLDSMHVEDSKLPNKDLINFNSLWSVWNTLQKEMYVEDSVDPSDVEYGMIKGVVESIGDDYTVFFDPEETEDFQISVDGELSGIGAEIGKKNKLYYVVNTLKNAPAFNAGLKAEDIILKINNEDVSDMSFKDLIHNIRGEKGSTVVLKIMRPSLGENIDFNIVRDDIHVPAIEFSILEDGIGYIELLQFSPSTYTELVTAIDSLKEDAMSKLILDLRDNGGGYLDQAMRVVSSFIKEGNVIQKEFSDGSRERVPVDGKVLLEDIPMVILINGYSASASEITAGTLQDYGRAKLVGEISFGKGTVQNTKLFSDGSMIKYTISKWLTGKGNDIHEIGIVPDYEVLNEEDSEEDLQLEKAIELLLE